MKRFPLKSKIQVQHDMIEYVAAGEGQLTLILINGSGGPVEGWYKIIQPLAEDNRVIAYNRPGISGSSKPTVPQDGNTIVDSLKELLNGLNAKPPYVLVGHSLGGLYANLFARRFPVEVSGLVLLEASHPNDLVLNQYQGKWVQWLNTMLNLFRSHSEHQKYHEVNFVKETVDQIEQADRFPKIPVYVITGGKKPHKWLMPTNLHEIRLQNQKDYVRLSQLGKQIIAPRSAHFPQMSEPDIVIKAIKDCVHHAKENLG